MGQARPSQAHLALARRLRTIDPAALGPDIPVHDEGLSVLQIPRSLMSREGEASERLAAIAAKAVADATLFPHARPLRGNVGRTHLLLRRGSRSGVGNHIKMITVPTIERPERRRFHVRRLARAQELSLSQWLVALSPRRLARLAMRIWYRNFDAIATLLPMPRNLQLGGRAVTAVFGVPPLWGPVPLVLVALADADQYHVMVIPGRGFSAPREALEQRIRELFEPPAMTRREPMLAEPQGRSRIDAARGGLRRAVAWTAASRPPICLAPCPRRPKWRARRPPSHQFTGQGWLGSISRRVRRPSREKSP